MIFIYSFFDKSIKSSFFQIDGNFAMRFVNNDLVYIFLYIITLLNKRISLTKSIVKNFYLNKQLIMIIKNLYFDKKSIMIINILNVIIVIMITIFLI